MTIKRNADIDYNVTFEGFDRTQTLRAIDDMINDLSDEKVAELFRWLVSQFPKKKSFYGLHNSATTTTQQKTEVNRSNDTRGIFTKVLHGGYPKRKPLSVREDSLTIALHVPGKNTIRLTLASANSLANAIREALTSD